MTPIECEEAVANDPLACCYEDNPRLSAYYYGFDSTGNRHIDAILSAVAWAGKGSHSTDSWTDEADGSWVIEYGPRSMGKSYADAIQETAKRAADYIDQIKREAFHLGWEAAGGVVIDDKDVNHDR